MWVRFKRLGYTVNSSEVYRNRSSSSTNYNRTYDQTTQYAASDFDDCTNGDKTVQLYVKWVPVNYNISYTLNGGTNASGNPTTYNIESSDISISNPTRTGYTFNGWNYSVNNLGWKEGYVNISTGAEEASTTYPNSWHTDFIKLKGGKTYTLSGYGDYSSSNFRWRVYDTNGTYLGQSTGGSIAATSYTPTQDCLVKILMFQESTDEQRSGLTITASGTDSEVVIPQGSTGNVTLTANWIENSYLINYALDGGTAGTYAPTSANYDEVIRVSNPTKEGYTFIGWSLTNGNAQTAMYGETPTTVTTSWSIVMVQVKDEYYKNLTPTNGETVILVAHWTSNTASITIKKDNYDWTTDNNVVVELRSSTNTYNGTKSGATVTWTAIPSGTYNIYASKNDTNQININTLIDTGIDLVITSSGTGTIDYYTLQLQPGIGISAVSGDGTYLKNQQANIDATVSTGYTWEGWSVISGNTPD